MLLDPELAEFLKNVSESGNKAFEIMSIDDMRQATKRLSVFYGDVEPVHKVETRAIKADDHDFLVRIYHPSPAKKLPMLLYFHAGGYVRGDVELCDPICRKIANRSSCIVISVNYRLAPEDKFPAALEDAYTTLCFAHRYAHEIGGSKDHIAVAGDSTGGNLATVLTLLTRERKGPKISFQILMYPVVDYTYSFPSHEKFAKGYFMTEEALKFYESQYFPPDADRKDPYISPYFIKHFDNLPPAYIITAECDPVRDEGEAYAEKLKKSGIKVVHYRFKGTMHAFIYFSPISKKADEAIFSVAEALHGFFRETIEKALHGQ
ncbi:lipase [Candidatus Aerophobetes bacterium]|uniref:Lipase n=1 Tax=Aerophobetes bacterium TaxID=2030807 RepID=A0A2A4YCW0_UNCAE|nr:MAG: lipase [Candidatus Aerophobetes bacterium]